MLAKPDPSTFQILPWRSDPPGTARMFCEVQMPDGSPSFADPRHVLSGPSTRRPTSGSPSTPTPRSSSSCSSRSPAPTGGPVDDAGYFDHVPHGTGHDFRRAAITMLENMGISVEFSHHEGAPGQERDRPALRTPSAHGGQHHDLPDIVKEVALSQGIYATFMPKPFAEHPGSGMHTLSLFEGDSNAFYEAGAPYQLSKTARQFIAGVITHGAEITAVTNQWVNSYKRLWGGERRRPT